ncbi:MAG: ComF family protein [Cellvibrionales bacterium]|nr:MAG: ComF family protein [Cellvibrionales bacterium]
MLRKRWFGSALSIPTQCWVCQAWPIFTLICEQCLAQHAPAQRRCSSCALVLPDSTTATTTAQCGACLHQAPPLLACWAAVDYAAPWRDLVHRWKLAQNPALAKAAAQLIHQQLPQQQWPLPAIAAQFDVLLPIPPAPERLQQRGFHHTLLLAQALRLGLPIDSSSLLRLPEAAGQHQALRKRQDRLRAMRGAFIVAPEKAAALQGLRVLLLDDVMTTGATLHSAAHNLLQAGAAQVGALVLARTGLGADAASKPVTPAFSADTAHPAPRADSGHRD